MCKRAFRKAEHILGRDRLRATSPPTTSTQPRYMANRGLRGAFLPEGSALGDIPKIFRNVLFVFNSCVRRHAERPWCIYCFAKYSIVFSGRAWLIYQACCCCSTLPLKMAICPVLSGDFHLSRTLETFTWRDKESLGALPLRNNAIEAHFQVECRVVLLSLAGVCKDRMYVFKWSPLQFTGTGNKPHGDSDSNCSGKLAKHVASAADMEPFPDPCQKTKEPGDEVPGDRSH